MPTKATKKTAQPNVYRPKQATQKSVRYKKEFVEQAAFLAKVGCTDAEVAEFFKVSTRTIHRWKNAHKEFQQALEIGKAEADQRVKDALYSRAVGYYKTVQKAFVRQSDGEVIFAEYQEHVSPDVTACIFWLKNREPHNWRERKEITGADGGPIEVDHTPRKVIAEKLQVMRTRLLSKPEEKDVVEVEAEVVDGDAAT